ncbi:MAG: hypothetical protein C0467_20785 [Planctomycetaceae bacterium]|nr:hypothetical protein [Planctomycetaceae bacterium]
MSFRNRSECVWRCNMDVGGTHVLVVDDMADVADSTVELLALWGYDAIACYDGVSALESAQISRPDAVLLDLAMPGMDGFQFASLFRELPGCRSAPIIAMSGYSTPVCRENARAVGIKQFLVKPVHAEQLKEFLAWEIEPLAKSYRSPAQTKWPWLMLAREPALV